MVSRGIGCLATSWSSKKELAHAVVRPCARAQKMKRGKGKEKWRIKKKEEGKVVSVDFLFR